MKCAWRVSLSLIVLAGCTPPLVAGDGIQSATNEQAFEGVSCSAVRPQTEPDLMAWDSGSRLNLKRLRAKGVVVVRYEAEGCNVKLELLPNCMAPGGYEYTPYSANEHKVAHNASELFAQFPIGAASLTGKVKGDRALRTDYMLVGQYALPPSASIARSDLTGADCARATHVVSATYVGGFALVSGEERSLEAAASVFGVGAGAQRGARAERVADEGSAEACKAAQASQKADGACDVPLRIGLLALGKGERCPSGSVRRSGACVPQGAEKTAPVGGVDGAASAPSSAATAARAPTEPAPAPPAAGKAGSEPATAFGGGLGQLVALPAMPAANVVAPSSSALASADVDLLRLLQVAKRADVDASKSAKDRAAAWATVAGYSSAHPYKVAAEERQRAWLALADAQAKRGAQIREMCIRHAADAEKLKKLLALDDQVVPPTRKAAYRDELTRAYATWEAELKGCPAVLAEASRLAAEASRVTGDYTGNVIVDVAYAEVRLDNNHKPGARTSSFPKGTALYRTVEHATHGYAQIGGRTFLEVTNGALGFWVRQDQVATRPPEEIQ